MHPGPTDTDFQRDIEVSATGARPDVAARIFEARNTLSRHACPEEIAAPYSTWPARTVPS
jgi:hypothetical protein